LALRPGWVSLRAHSHTLLVRATNLFGVIETTGAHDKCTLGIELWTDSPERGDAAIEGILSEFRQYEFRDISFSLNWRFVDGKGNIARASTEERASGEVLDEAYPCLAEVQTFIDEYLESPETVLVVQGPPGTGKTRLIRAILAAISARAGESADVLYTGDSAVLESDEVFLEFITDSHRAFVVEDADHLIKPIFRIPATSTTRWCGPGGALRTCIWKHCRFRRPSSCWTDSAATRPNGARRQWCC
jgi:hypothetical protein